VRIAVAALGMLMLSACASAYSGPARPTTRGAIEAQPGWMLAATPELRQTTATDCGPTALAMVAARWGVEPARAIADVAERGSVDNVSFVRLRATARKLGLSAYVIAGNTGTLAYELRRGRPVVIGLLRPYGARARQGHYEVVVGVHLERELIATIDPAAGWRVRTFAQLEREWAPAKHPAMVVLGRFDQIVDVDHLPPKTEAQLGSTESSLAALVAADESSDRDSSRR
jgi:hypothetical protein